MYINMRRTKEEALITRNNLLSAALAVISEQGYSATSLDDIAAAAGVTRGAIYHHFGGKVELFTALVEERSTDINRIMKQALEEGGSPGEKLRLILVRLFEYSDDEDYRAMLSLATSKVEYTSELETFWKQNVSSRRELVRFLTDLIREGIQQGDFRKDLSANDAAIAVAGFMNGVGLMWVQDPLNYSLSNRAEALVDAMLGGLAA